MAKFKPFADDAASISVGELTIENGTDRIALYGSIDLTRDNQGLAHARALMTLLDQAIQLLGADKSLPDAVPPPAAARTVKNPFGDLGPGFSDAFARPPTMLNDG